MRKEIAIFSIDSKSTKFIQLICIQKYLAMCSGSKMILLLDKNTYNTEYIYDYQ